MNNLELRYKIDSFNEVFYGLVGSLAKNPYWIVSISFALAITMLILKAYKARRAVSLLMLVDLGVSSTDSILKVKRMPKWIEIEGVSSKVLSSQFWRDKLEQLGHIFRTQLIDVKIESGRKPKIKLYKDLLPIRVGIDLMPDLKPMQAWIGKNQYDDDVILNLQETPAIYIDGRPGAGKTVAIKTIAHSFARGVNTSKIRFVIITTKPADYYDLKDSAALGEIEIIDPNEGDFEQGLLKIKSEIERVSILENDFKAIAATLKIETENMNLEYLRAQGIYEEQPRIFFILDEAKDYLSKEKADPKNITQAKEELISSIYTHIRRTARYLSTPIIIGSQTQAESDLGVPLKAFHLRLASNTNEAMSRLICGDSRLTDLTFRKGKYFLKSDREEHILRVAIK